MFKIRFSFLIITFFFVVQAYAQPVRLSGNFDSVTAIASSDTALDVEVSPSGEVELPTPLVISGHLKELGRFRAKFEVRKIFQGADKEGLIVLQGAAKLRRKKKAIVSAVLKPIGNGDYELILDFMDEGKVRYKVKRAFRLIRVIAVLNKQKGNWDYELTKFHRDSKRPVKERVCGADGLTAFAPDLPASSSRDVQTTATYKVISIILDGDPLYENMVGSISTGITTMMNLVDSWYKRDLGIAFDVTINPTAVSYSSDVGYDEEYNYPIHAEMQAKRPASSRAQFIHYLITGKSSESTAGVAYVRTACRDKDYAIGFTIWFEDDDTFNYETTAHEIGHIFGADHDDDETGTVAYIMNSGTEGGWTDYLSEFSTFSKSQIASHISTYSSCLTDGSGNVEEGGGEGGGNSGETPAALQVLLKKKKWPRRAIIIGKYDNGSRAEYKPAELLCGYSTGDLTISQDYNTLNRKGRRALRYQPRNFPAYCKAVIYDDDYETTLGESEVKRMGRNFGS